MKQILVTGGCGYIGSHIVLELLLLNKDVIVVDNCVNSNKNVLKKIEKYTKRNVLFYECDMCNHFKLDYIFKTNNISHVIHLAALKAVNESVNEPLKYYENNMLSTLNLLKCMKNNKCYNLIYSSSACVYGTPKYLPLDEKHPTSPINPYGQTKIMSEQILKDYSNANKETNITILRYFNPIGVHPSNILQENPKNKPNNIMPILLSCIKENKTFTVFGNQYKTKDGTCVRDYIHVVDLAIGHIKSLDKMNKYQIYNLGTGNGYSVLEVIYDE